MSRYAPLLITALLGLALIKPAPSQADESTATQRDTPETSEVLSDPVVFPGHEWDTASPERFGFSTEKLNEVKSYFEEIGGDTCVVVKSGYVIVSWGDTTLPIPNLSFRKSFLNSLLGIEYGRGRLNLDASLDELNIDDIGGLTDAEKQASLRHLMSASSGVFHEAAHESEEQKGARPPRGSFKPGAFFYYNNWDFNALGHIYSNISGKDIFEAFSEGIAGPIGMQDFDLQNTAYEFEKASNYPAYLFKSSARDDARFGYLYLRNGRWQDRQLIPTEWVSMSLSPQVKTSKYYYYDYGFLWWVDEENEQYFARGNSGQFIAVLPREDMVIVFRADPGSVFYKWLGLRVSPEESFPLIPKILQARSLVGMTTTTLQD